MTASDGTGEGRSRAGRPQLRTAGLWALLIVLSLAAAALCQRAGVPAALLLGPLLVGIGFGVTGSGLKPPRNLRTIGMAVLGTIMGASMARAYTPAFALHLPVFLGVGVLSLAAALGLGWFISRQGWLSGATAVWGLAPGASSAMVGLAEADGGDVRIVGLMQYFRILLVAAAAVAMAHGLAPDPEPVRAGAAWLVPLDPTNLLAVAALVALGLATDRWTSIPAGALLVTALLGSFVQLRGWAHVAAPPLLAISAYAMVGWTIGLGFTREVLVRSVRLFPLLFGSIGALIALCGLLSCLLVVVLKVDPLTAYLAASPGGVDAMLIIAASSDVDLPFILSAQTVRFLLIVAFGPPLVRAIVRRAR